MSEPHHSDKDVEFTFCKFEGPPPAPFSSWGEWMKSHPKKGVLIRCLTKEDLAELERRVT